MVPGYHVIFSTYGFWLPNDPRGSWSDFLGALELFCYGSATKTDLRASVAHVPHDRAARLAAKTALKYPAVKLNGLQAQAVDEGFAVSAEKGGVIVWTCAILPEHVHMVLARHRSKVEMLINCIRVRRPGSSSTRDRIRLANGTAVRAATCRRAGAAGAGRSSSTTRRRSTGRYNTYTTTRRRSVNCRSAGSL